MTDNTINLNETVDVSDNLSAKTQKQKLTLGINRDVVEKAKEAGINISEITEQLLTAMTFNPKGNTDEDVILAYNSFLDAVTQQLKRYSTSLEVGQVEYAADPDNDPDDTRERWTYYLDRDGITMYGIVIHQGQEHVIPQSKKASLVELLPHMYEPKKILEKLIRALTSAAEYNKERLAQLDFCMRLVQTLKDENLEPPKK